MKFKIFDRDEKPVKPVILSLKQYGDGEVVVAVVDEKGGLANNLLRFTKDGTISRCTSVSTDYGFQLIEGGRIVIEGVRELD